MQDWEFDLRMFLEEYLSVKGKDVLNLVVRIIRTTYGDKTQENWDEAQEYANWYETIFYPVERYSNIPKWSSVVWTLYTIMVFGKSAREYALNEYCETEYEKKLYSLLFDKLTTL